MKVKQPIFSKPPYPGESEKIELKNIDLTGWTLEREIEKFNEEVNEFINVINNKDDDITFFHAVEELFDILQAGIGIIYLKYKKKAKDITRLYKYHLIKIKNRPR